MCNHDQIVYMPILAVDYRINWGTRIYPAEIDACLAPHLFKLHKLGIKTLHSCCRHGTPLEKGEGHITIEKESVSLAIKHGYNVVSRWEIYRVESYSYRRFEIILPDELIGKSNHSLEDYRNTWDNTIGKMMN